MSYDDTSLYTCIHIGLILYFYSEKDNTFRVRHCIENLRKWGQNLLHTGRKKSNGFRFDPFGGVRFRLKERAKKCRSGATLIKFRSSGQ
jgi:hypothetical protein